jgi:hypothetical protein
VRLAWPADALVSWSRSSRELIAVTLEAGQVWRRPISLLSCSFSDRIYKLSGLWLDRSEENFDQISRTNTINAAP